jgi:hypothetical protein
MNNSLLQFAYFQYSADIPHANIIQALINKGADPTEAQHILDIASIKYCTKSVAVSQPAEPAEEETGLGTIINIILTIIGLAGTVMKCMN